MPSTMTHSYFACDVYEKLINKNNISSIENFKLYSQGSDPFMFYNYLIGKKNKYYCKIQNTIHTKNTNKYFVNIIKYIIDNNLVDNKDLITFLYGNICHYFLDLWTHPFIYYKTGKFDKKVIETYKYNAIHQDMEYTIDKYFIEQRSNDSVNKFKIHREIFNNYKIDDVVINCLVYTLRETYNIDDVGNNYKKSVKMMKRFFYLFNYDPLGIKKRIYTFIDMVTPRSVINIRELSYYSKDINTNYLNLDRKEWNHPAFKNEVYNYSFLDLYNNALNDTLEAIEIVDEIIKNKKMNNYKLKRIFKNLSYVTGKRCNLKIDMKYFEF